MSSGTSGSFVEWPNDRLRSRPSAVHVNFYRTSASGLRQLPLDISVCHLMSPALARRFCQRSALGVHPSLVPPWFLADRVNESAGGRCRWSSEPPVTEAKSPRQAKSEIRMAALKPSCTRADRARSARPRLQPRQGKSWRWGEIIVQRRMCPSNFYYFSDFRDNFF